MLHVRFQKIKFCRQAIRYNETLAAVAARSFRFAKHKLRDLTVLSEAYPLTAHRKTPVTPVTNVNEKIKCAQLVTNTSSTSANYD